MNKLGRKITEIIPDDMPEWAEQAITEGQFFNVACKAMQELELIKAGDHILREEIAKLCGEHERLVRVINDIKEHIRRVSGTAYKLSGTYHIACQGVPDEEPTLTREAE